jgi:hypothetical protein
MKNVLKLIIGLALGLGFSLPVYALEAPRQASVPWEAHLSLEKSVKKEKKHKKIGVFKRSLLLKALKKGFFRGKTWIQLRAEKLGNAALYTFIGALILLVIGGFISVALLYAGLFVLLASNSISFVILATEEDKKARKIAKTVLWATLALVVIGLILFLIAYLFLLAFFAAIFG